LAGLHLLAGCEQGFLSLTVSAHNARGTRRPLPADREPPHSLFVVLLALGPFGLGYFLSYVFRAVNAVVEEDLVREIGLDPSELGFMTAAYLGAFALFQLPLGVLLDRYGPRQVQAVLMSIAALGALLFAFGRDGITLTVARALIGLGVAGGLMSGFKSVVLWVSEPRRALANSFVMSAGAIGLLVATRPIQDASDIFGWRQVFLILAGLTFLAALIILLVVPEHERQPGGETLGRQVSEIIRIFRDPAIISLAPLLATTAGVHVAIQTLWAGPWFRDVMGVGREEVANQLFYMAAAFFFGILFTGTIADWFARRGFSLLSVMVGFQLIYLAAQAGIVLQWTEYSLILWLVFGMSGQVAILAYPWLASYFGSALSGRAHTAVNLLIFGCAFLAQYAIGAIIELYPPSGDGGYPPQSYRTAFGAFLMIQVAAMVWFALTAGFIRRRSAA
jgi:predicted MFS family arabinose efflux permease